MIRKLYDEDVYLFRNGTHRTLFELFGAHVGEVDGVAGVMFRVWAKTAQSVQVIGSFNDWNRQQGFMNKVHEHGIFELFVPVAKEYDEYKYLITAANGELLEKSDPFAFFSENRPGTNSIVFDIDGFRWQDRSWQKQRLPKNYQQPMNIYEVHAGSWRHNDNDEISSYTDLAETLIPYVKKYGYNYIEFMPLMEHPLDASWGYQVSGFYAATHRYGTPKQLMALINEAHQHEVGVILDWVPVHFCKDATFLVQFDGTPLYEYSESQNSENEWGSLNFDFSSPEVCSFLISNALFWLQYYHADGLRLDAVANIIYWQGRKDRGENSYGIAFLKELNKAITETVPAALITAEDSTDYQGVTEAIENDGLGFDYKWNMGWMNDTFAYMQAGSDERREVNDKLTFSFHYMYNERYILPYSHDEVVHGKFSILNKMPGSYEEKFPQARALFGLMYAHPGKKLQFMGNEFAQVIEFDEKRELDWLLMKYPLHDSFHEYMKKLHHIYLRESALWYQDYSFDGFRWITNVPEQNVLAFARFGKTAKDTIVMICNFSDINFEAYTIGVPPAKYYQEILNSDAFCFSGSGVVNDWKIKVFNKPMHEQNQSMTFKLPPFSTIYFKAGK